MASRLKKLLTDGQVIEGTLTRVTVGSAAHYQLTSKERGKTKTVYVPLCARQKVEQWARRWKDAKALLKGLSLKGSDMIATVNYHSSSVLWYNHRHEKLSCQSP